MFGYVTANTAALSKEDKSRYSAVYCGICRAIKDRGGQLDRCALSYDMAFLALLHMSLYEPEEAKGENPCIAHPLRKSPWTDNRFIRYAADMNLALAYYKAQDDRLDDHSAAAAVAAKQLSRVMPAIKEAYPRQCDAIEKNLEALRTQETAEAPDADQCATAFGQLMGELLVYEQDLWAENLYEMGLSLGRFIYYADAAEDYRRDKRRGSFNPFLVMNTGEDYALWEQYLLLAMGRCTEHFEKLPLVQDKQLLDNILYSGVWGRFRGMRKRREGKQ